MARKKEGKERNVKEYRQERQESKLERTTERQTESKKARMQEIKQERKKDRKEERGRKSVPRNRFWENRTQRTVIDKRTLYSMDRKNAKTCTRAVAQLQFRPAPDPSLNCSREGGQGTALDYN